MNSSFLSGVGEDAADLADHIAARGWFRFALWRRLAGAGPCSRKI